MYELNNILLTLLTIGGVGFINYLVTDQLGTTQLYKEAKEVRLGYCLLWDLSNAFTSTKIIHPT